MVSKTSTTLEKLNISSEIKTLFHKTQCLSTLVRSCSFCFRSYMFWPLISTITNKVSVILKQFPMGKLSLQRLTNATGGNIWKSWHLRSFPNFRLYFKTFHLMNLLDKLTGIH